MPSTPSVPPPLASTLAQRENLVLAAGTPIEEEIPLVLDTLLKPHSRYWYDHAHAYLGQAALAPKLLVADRLPDALTNRRNAHINLNSGAYALQLFERIVAQEPTPVIARAARWTGIITLRSALRERTHGGEGLARITAGRGKWEIQSWVYRSNIKRANALANHLLLNDRATVRKPAQRSVDFWMQYLPTSEES